ncbi:VOC family protein [Melissococcus plutonius]|uniref:Glyoxalase family protein n=1 Tax=Melissococcus plutonius (strain ATCC 35311 / DSM 29964 / CIP 104052 / LMG 20360 / NCIMB 702443) TaxID=940190 RepID=F3YBV2_MELPT|nr:VOC family protein [Melissococcus plutonius]AIM25929.1 glyoxalase family protein [Melissococcus plutonius S1]KMT23936.1 glyoxalase family protein [Melissococcus plutonius]KMT24459.1 glyoxalase family protein [Melissococcus plutonius]KMT26032.1 glyoxalase family protein [Melissococcus plutonius]KMT28581.1 glyoxalase family protein [Melissococcus plutonius]
MNKFKLPKNIYVKTVALRINNSEEMLKFYRDIVGFVLKTEENNLSVFGTVELDSQLLILEEMESIEQGSKTKRLAGLSLRLPNEVELATIARRIVSNKYPIEGAIIRNARRSIFLLDPEGNRLELYCNVPLSLNEEKGDLSLLNLDKLLQKGLPVYHGLSKEAKFDLIYLNTEKNRDSVHFYQNTLGMSLLENYNNILTMGEGHFSIALQEDKLNERSIANKNQLGIEFLICPVVCDGDMRQLEEHLQAEQVNFFIDKRKTFITIYDKLGIEWWFMRHPNIKK